MNYFRKNILYILFLGGINVAILPQKYLTNNIAVPPTSSNFTYPQSVFVDSPNGHIWVADFDNHRVLRFDATITSVIKSDDLLSPQGFFLSQNYPNPFNGVTQITFSAEVTGDAILSVYNLLGQKIITLFEGIATASTTYAILFDAKDLPSGIYFYSLRTEYGISVKRMCLLK